MLQKETDRVKQLVDFVKQMAEQQRHSVAYKKFAYATRNDIVRAFKKRD